jgi:hypothetical protein
MRDDQDCDLLHDLDDVILAVPAMDACEPSAVEQKPLVANDELIYRTWVARTHGVDEISVTKLAIVDLRPSRRRIVRRVAVTTARAVLLLGHPSPHARFIRGAATASRQTLPSTDRRRKPLTSSVRQAGSRVRTGYLHASRSTF